MDPTLLYQQAPPERQQSANSEYVLPRHMNSLHERILIKSLEPTKSWRVKRLFNLINVRLLLTTWQSTESLGYFHATFILFKQDIGVSTIH